MAGIAAGSWVGLHPDSTRIHVVGARTRSSRRRRASTSTATGTPSGAPAKPRAVSALPVCSGPEAILGHTATLCPSHDAHTGGRWVHRRMWDEPQRTLHPPTVPVSLAPSC